MQTIQFKFNNRVVSNTGINPVSFISRIARGTFTLVLLLLPLIFLAGTLTYNEDLGFGLYATATFISVGCFISLLLYKGRKLLIDPDGFINVLIFSLFVITPSVISSPSSSANTFGLIQARSLSGLATILFVIAFYLINLFNLKERIWNLLPRIASVSNIAILFGFASSGIATSTSATASPLVTVLTLVALVNFLLALKLKLNNERIVNSVVFSLVVIFGFKFISTEFKIAASAFLTLFFYLLILRIIRRIGVSNLKKEFTTNFRLQIYTAGIAVSILTLLMTVLTFGIGNFPSVTKITNYFTNFGSIDLSVVTTILFGNGLSTSVMNGNSTLFVIISGFGLFALIGFLYLFFYVISKEIKQRNLVNVLIMSVIGLSSIFMNLGIYINMIFLFILIGQQKSNTFLINTTVQTKNKYLRIARKILVVIIMILASIITINLLRLLAILP